VAVVVEGVLVAVVLTEAGFSSGVLVSLTPAGFVSFVSESATGGSDRLLSRSPPLRRVTKRRPMPTASSAASSQGQLRVTTAPTEVGAEVDDVPVVIDVGGAIEGCACAI
jgi:hypothetical protein